MGTYKGYVRNFAHPDGSITAAYVVDEAITFLSRYLHDTKTRFTRVERNWDAPTTKFKMELFNNKSVSDDVFQEEDSSELPSFHPIEDVPDTSSLVREDVAPITLSHEMLLKLRNEKFLLLDQEDNIDDLEDYDDDGRPFINDEVTLESDTDSDSNEFDFDDDYDDIP
ncbi:hypothetical protein DH2020_006288 [Rehmannia glutinosa]|uniref:DUF4218 domain-containing protein n=1 Tax=Rehmannia glutinosa TaxID=99300 RepID=A0ABR0XIF3_REHGL